MPRTTVPLRSYSNSRRSNRHPTTWSGRSEIEVETASWVQWFNTTRLHSSIDYLSPIDYEARYRELITAAPAGAVA